jgi:hypothetical protein
MGRGTPFGRGQPSRPESKNASLQQKSPGRTSIMTLRGCPISQKGSSGMPGKHHP